MFSLLYFTLVFFFLFSYLLPFFYSASLLLLGFFMYASFKSHNTDWPSSDVFDYFNLPKINNKYCEYLKNNQKLY